MMTHRNASIYYAAFESSRDAIVLIEGDRFVKCNDAAVTMFEAVTKDGLLDSSPSDFSPSTQPDGSASEALSHTHIQEAMEKGSALFEWTHRTLRGRSFLAEVQLSRVDTGKGVLVQGVVRDITERRATELALQRSNEQLEHFVPWWRTPSTSPGSGSLSWTTSTASCGSAIP